MVLTQSISVDGQGMVCAVSVASKLPPCGASSRSNDDGWAVRATVHGLNIADTCINRAAIVAIRVTNPRSDCKTVPAAAVTALPARATTAFHSVPSQPVLLVWRAFATLFTTELTHAETSVQMPPASAGAAMYGPRSNAAGRAAVFVTRAASATNARTTIVGKTMPAVCA